jgi:ABC-2 type transport system permease protein
MSNILAIWRRELAGTFGNPLAYIVLAIFTGLLAIPSLWIQDVLVAGEASMNTPFWWTAVCLLFLAPAITMRVLAEERRSGTFELLSTLPVTPTQIVVGKWLASVVIVLLALLLTASYPIALSMLGDLDWGPVIGGYLGLALMGSAFAAIGTATSALTRYQVLAFLLAFVVCVVPWALGFALPTIPADWVAWVQYLTFQYHHANLARGVLDTRSIVFFGTVIIVALRTAVLLLDHHRLS